MEIRIVMGTAASGKSHFIKENFADCQCFDIFNYQEKEFEAAGGEDHLEIHQYREVLAAANEKIIQDVVRLLEHTPRNDRTDIVIEHTLFKAKRRITLIEAIRRVSDVPIGIYVMMPSEKQLRANLKSRGNDSEREFDNIKNEMKMIIEFPNSAEGYSHIYKVVDGAVMEIDEPADESIVKKAKAELEAEAKLEKAGKMTDIKAELPERFLHVCSGCGKREVLSGKEAFEQGWDYPGPDGIYKDMPNFGFKMMLPRTCGNCGIEKSLYWKLLVAKEETRQGEQEEKMQKNMQEEMERILREPMSLIVEV